MENNDIDLNALLDRQAPTEERRPRVNGRFWASDFGKCHRQVYYSFTEPLPVPTGTMRIFDIGNLIHGYFQTILKECEGKEFASIWNERHITLNDVQELISISGSIDTLVKPVVGEPFILEFKSVSGTGLELKTSVQYTHRCQLTMYLRAEMLSHGYVVYISKEDMRLKMFRVDYDDSLFKRLMSDARNLHYCIRNRHLPPASPHSNYECHYCVYDKICKLNSNKALHAKLFPNRVGQPGGEYPVSEPAVSKKAEATSGGKLEGTPKPARPEANT